MISIINLTPHTVVVLAADGQEVAVFAPSGSVARIAEIVTHEPPLATSTGSIPVATVTYSSVVEGLPERSLGAAYVVSRVLAGAVFRPDVFFPGGEVRDASGRIIGCRYLARMSPAGER